MPQENTSINIYLKIINDTSRSFHKVEL